MREAERNIASAGRASLDLDRLWTKPMTPGTRGKVTVFSTLCSNSKAQLVVCGRQ